MERTLDLVTTQPLVSLPRVERLAWERAVPGYHHHAQSRAVRCVAIQVTLAGCGWVWPTPTSAPLAVPQGSALMFITGDPPLAYGLGTSAAWEFVYANIVGSSALSIASELIARHGHVVALTPDHPAVRALLVRVPKIGNQETTIDTASSACLACDLLTSITEMPPIEETGNAALVAGAMAFFRKRLGDDIGVAEAARHLRVSREHLSRIFGEHSSLAPGAWLRRLRLQHAERLLRSSDPHSEPMPVAEVARSCGFATTSHFTQAFRAHSGSTPAAFRMRSRS